jgi:hypothetical protein
MSPETDYWEEDPDYPVADWKYEVANGNTRMGYWEWVECNRDGEAADEAESESAIGDQP